MSQLSLFSDPEPITSASASTGICMMCQSEMTQIAPRGWQCQGNGYHRFELVQAGLGVWRDRSPWAVGSGRAVDPPTWAIPCSWTAVGLPELEGRARV